MSRSGLEHTASRDDAEANAHRNAAALGRIRNYLARHRIIVVGDQYIHALEQLRQPAPEPVLDAGWPPKEMGR